MTVQTAKEIITAGFPDLTPIECTEYSSLIVFDMRPKGKVNVPDMIDSLISINKTTGEISDFKPFYISKEEYEKGHKVPI